MMYINSDNKCMKDFYCPPDKKYHFLLHLRREMRKCSHDIISLIRNFYNVIFLLDPPSDIIISLCLYCSKEFRIYWIYHFISVSLHSLRYVKIKKKFSEVMQYDYENIRVKISIDFDV